MLVALALALSYLENLIPPIVPVPGVKVGLANSVTLLALYTLDKKSAAFISAVRVALSALLFGSAVSLIYSASGALLSFVVMICAMKIGKNSIVGVSVVGAVFHNVAQVAAAAAVMESMGVLYYIAPLLISGTASGFVTGALSGVIIEKTKDIIKKFK